MIGLLLMALYSGWVYVVLGPLGFSSEKEPPPFWLHFWALGGIAVTGASALLAGEGHYHPHDPMWLWADRASQGLALLSLGQLITVGLVFYYVKRRLEDTQSATQSGVDTTWPEQNEHKVAITDAMSQRHYHYAFPDGSLVFVNQLWANLPIRRVLFFRRTLSGTEYRWDPRLKVDKVTWTSRSTRKLLERLFQEQANEAAALTAGRESLQRLVKATQVERSMAVGGER